MDHYFFMKFCILLILNDRKKIKSKKIKYCSYYGYFKPVELLYALRETNRLIDRTSKSKVFKERFFQNYFFTNLSWCTQRVDIPNLKQFHWVVQILWAFKVCVYLRARISSSGIQLLQRRIGLKWAKKKFPFVKFCFKVL